MTNFHVNLKNFRISQGLDQKQLAEILGVRNTTISGWENNHHEPSIDMLIKIAHFFDVSYEDLLL